MVFLFLGILWLVLSIVSLGVGQYHIPFDEVFVLLAKGFMAAPISESLSIPYDVIFSIRLPRVLMASLAGGALALSGIALQGVFKNPLVGPHIVGVSTGAAFGGTLAILFEVSKVGLFGFAFVFGILALMMVYALASFVSKHNLFALILSGIVVSGFFSALISLIQYISDEEEKLPNIVYWLLGSFSSANYERVALLAIPTIPIMIIFVLMRWRFNLLSLQDHDMRLLGINITKLRLIILGLCSLIIAAQVSVSGNVGWIGLVIPHLSRMLVGVDHRKSLPTAILLGAIFMLVVDNVSRTITQGEVPLGILTALIGAPVFAYLMKKNGIRNNDNG